MRTLVLSLALSGAAAVAATLGAAACGGSTPSPESTPTALDTEPPPPGVAAPMAPEECEAQGGFVKGDIGDGQVACTPGEENLGRVNQGIEGAICCKAGAP